MIEYLLTACEVCERGAAIAELRQVLFADGRLSAFNGIYQYQAHSGLPREERFAISEQRLASALQSCTEELQVTSTKEFLKLKNGPFTVRLRKIETQRVLERISIPKQAATQKPTGLQAALRLVREFISTDASRPWSTAALLKEGYAWATNNLALVRVPVTIPAALEGIKIPVPVVEFLCSLPSLDHFHIDSVGQLIFASGRALVRFPQAQADWPDLAKFFDKMPKELPPLPPEMRRAASQVGKFADRFVSVEQLKVEGKSESMETEYEVDLEKGKGLYNSKLLSLIVAHATHADFSFYPEPIFFKGDGIEGTAVGMKVA